MADRPQLANDPLEILAPDPDRIQPLLTKYWGPGVCSIAGFLAVCFGNFATSRPALSGLQKHFFTAIAGGYIGHLIEQYRANYLAERDAVYRHYIQLHPEDFPVPERKKFADVLERWMPIR